jgi:hypothetical protein
MAAPHSPPSSNNTSPSSIRQYGSYPDNRNYYGSSTGSEWYPYEAEAHQDMFFEPTRDGSRIVKRGKTPYGFPCDAMEQEVSFDTCSTLVRNVLTDPYYLTKRLNRQVSCIRLERVRGDR